MREVKVAWMLPSRPGSDDRIQVDHPCDDPLSDRSPGFEELA
jgi:hypothetical protein